MKYEDIEVKVNEYRNKLKKEFVDECVDVKYKIGQVVLRKCYKDEKLSFTEPLYVKDVYFQPTEEGFKFKGYFLHAITPTGRVSEKGIYYVPLDVENSYYFAKHSYRESISLLNNTLNEYKAEYINVKVG